MYLLDTDVAIWHLRNRADIRELVRRLSREEGLAISVLVRLEVRTGMTEWERPATEEFLASVAHYDVTEAIADRASDFVRNYGRKGVTLAVVDAVVAATAAINDLVLVTLNQRH